MQKQYKQSKEVLRNKQTKNKRVKFPLIKTKRHEKFHSSIRSSIIDPMWRDSTNKDNNAISCRQHDSGVDVRTYNGGHDSVHDVRQVN